MCGINGIFNLDGDAVFKEDLMKMNSMMIHRGPDDEGFYIDKNIGLSMRRLSIIDIKGGHQPITDERKRYWIILNGEIYNYIELRKELKNKNHVFKTNTDTEVLVHLYEEFGEECLKKLNGIFVFAIWDKYKRELFIANDRLGIKPLFYYKNGASFCFSSELKSLLTLRFDKQIEYNSVLLYLFLLYVPYPMSMVKGVYKLEPATYIKIDENGRYLKKLYWEIESSNSVSKINIEEFKETFLYLLSDAVRLQLRSDVSVGTFLSGGIDSSCVVAMASRINKGIPVRTFSVGYEGHYIDERPYARKIAEMYRTDHKELFITKDDIIKGLRRFAWYMDEPIGDSAAIPIFLLSELARESGVKVILNGTGGDEVFGGYPRYLIRKPERYLKYRLYPLFNFTVSLLKNPLDIKTAINLTDKLISYLCRVNGTFIGLMSFLKEKSALGILLKNIDNIMKNYFEFYGNLREEDRFIFFDLKTYLVNDLLFLLDKTTIAASIEGRVPLIDYRIVEFMSTIPANVKMKGGNLKWLVKQALKGILPDEILYRDKMGFGGPVSFWLSEGIVDELEVFCGENMSPITKELFKVDRIQQTIKNKKYDRWNAQFLYNLSVFELWYNEVYKGGSVDKSS